MNLEAFQTRVIPGGFYQGMERQGADERGAELGGLVYAHYQKSLSGSYPLEATKGYGFNGRWV
jgi:hypothetical protein